MEKKIFCKRYLPEMLFALVGLLTLLGVIYCMSLGDRLSTFTVIVAVIIQMIVTEVFKSRYPDKIFKSLWFAYIYSFSSIMIVLSLYTDNMYLLLGVTLVLMGDALDRYRRDKEALEFEEKYPFSHDIDVLCETDDGRMVRLPFKKRFLGNPIGIFPFKNEPEYIELREFSDKKDMNGYTSGSLFPNTDFCNRIAENLEQLNLCLKELESPIINGDYYAENPLMKGMGVVVSFKKGNIESMPYEGQESIKFRMIGIYYGEYKPFKIIK